MIKDYKLEKKVTILPFSKNVESILLNSDILAITSKTETFSMTVLEAMECGLTVISYKLNGPCEIITNKEDGVIVEHGNKELFISELENLINNDSVRNNYATRAKSNVKRFNIERIADIWDKLFVEILEN